MKSLKLKHVIVVVCLSISAPLGLADIVYPDFSSVDGLSLNGDAGQFNDRLRIVPGHSGALGSAWYDEMQQVQVKFTTTFQFLISDMHYYPADGFAFVIQHESLSALGQAGCGEWLGYDGITNSLAVEFDIISNSGQNDPVGNHVSVHTNGIDPNKANHDYSLGSTTQIPDLLDGAVHTTKIDYDMESLTIFIDDLENPVLQVMVDLGSTLELDKGRAWVGFTAATGDYYASFDILNWSLIDASVNYLHVPADYPTIQDAIDAASHGDTVLVAPGTYVENIDFKEKAITVKSEQGSANTVIDGNQSGSVVTCVSGEDADSVLKGFTLTNGSGTFNGSYFVGGGIYCDSTSPTITNNTIMGNTTSDGTGGGISCYYSSPTITNNTITGNTTSSGVIYCQESDAIITNNTISDNTANYAGGIYCCSGSSPTITNNTISGNSAGKKGGAISCYNSSSPTITNNTITGNTAGLEGGGIWCRNSSPTITNTILWDNGAPTGPEIWIGSASKPSTLTISYSDVKGGQSLVNVEPGCTLNWGSGMINAAPLWVDPDNGDFHITYYSPCRGSGDNTAQDLSSTDFEGDPRIYQAAVDIGADEFCTHLYYTGKALPGNIVYGKFVGLPGTSPVCLFFGTGICDPPMPTMWGGCCLEAPLLMVQFAPIPSYGVLIVPASVPLFPSAPYDVPMQALIGLNQDSLTNLCVLEVR